MSNPLVEVFAPKKIGEKWFGALRLNVEGKPVHVMLSAEEPLLKQIYSRVLEQVHFRRLKQAQARKIVAGLVSGMPAGWQPTSDAIDAALRAAQSVPGATPITDFNYWNWYRENLKKPETWGNDPTWFDKFASTVLTVGGGAVAAFVPVVGPAMGAIAIKAGQEISKDPGKFEQGALVNNAGQTIRAAAMGNATAKKRVVSIVNGAKAGVPEAVKAYTALAASAKLTIGNLQQAASKGNKSARVQLAYMQWQENPRAPLASLFRSLLAVR